ncbi:MAG: AzlC family ABC transporter permease, partial [Pseudomonadota bacterium]
MAAASSKTAFWRGARVSAPFLLVAGPFGMLFGVVAAEAGLSLAQIMAFSTIVIAGASQFTAVQLMAEQAAIWVILASALAVNLRMAMYSAALQPHLGQAPLWQRALIAYCNIDQSFAVASTEFDGGAKMTLPERVAFFLGAAAPITVGWVGATWLGAVLGAAIPEAFALDFALPITFIALIGPALRTAAHVGAAVVSVLLALLFAWAPFNLGLFVAAFGAMAVGAELERRGFG